MLVIQFVFDSVSVALNQFFFSSRDGIVTVTVIWQRQFRCLSYKVARSNLLLFKSIIFSIFINQYEKLYSARAFFFFSNICHFFLKTFWCLVSVDVSLTIIIYCTRYHFFLLSGCRRRFIHMIIANKSLVWTKNKR